MSVWIVAKIMGERTCHFYDSSLMCSAADPIVGRYISSWFESSRESSRHAFHKFFDLEDTKVTGSYI